MNEFDINGTISLSETTIKTVLLKELEHRKLVEKYLS